MKIIQLSKSTCPPCIVAKRILEGLDDIEYNYYDLEGKLNEEANKILKLAQKKKIRRLPIIAKIEEGKVIFFKQPVNIHVLKDFVYGE